MFKNMGGKIKKLSEVITTVDIIFSVILAIVIMLPGDIMILVGLVVMAIGIFFAWIGSFLLYGYGQLIENSDKLVLLHVGENEANEPDLEKKEREQKPSLDKTTVKETKIGKCDICKKDNLPVANYTIKDRLGTRYRNICENCAENYNA